MTAETSTRGVAGGAKLAWRVAGASLVVFLLASLIASWGYPSWMWWFVAAGLVLPPAALVVTVVFSVWARLART